ncbi:MAG: right-handed parallel beta-helix repeat-containing protein, partial [Planctomycetes bacterium]|nr:right-handed parallel beta-helix repeat-containing protein [Planctomycetota bacterium]
LCEIDKPGEWYIDRERLVLYVWPPADPESGVFELSQGDFPMVEIAGASHLAIVGLAWELGGADGIILRGGERCLIAGCAVRRLGGNGIEVRGGKEHTILSCDVESMGRGGVVLAGGDRRSLIPGGHVIENCHIRDLSRIDHTYTPGVLLDGVGNRISHNLVHGVASSAFRVEGNDHRIECNEVFDVLLESDDQGGADMWGNATYRGNIFRWNWWHHLGHWQAGAEQPGCGQAGIRLDDAICGVLIHGNIFQKCSAGALGFGGVQIHGGKENIIDANLFIDCSAAISFSPWGENRWKQFIQGALSKGGIDRDLYLERYPDLARLAEGHDANRVWRNVAVRCGQFLRRDPGRQELVENWVVPAGHEAAAMAIEALVGEASPAIERTGWRPIPIEEIGLYEDEHRRSLPTRLLRKARER